jgi:hypothetical protein
MDDILIGILSIADEEREKSAIFFSTITQTL